MTLQKQEIPINFTEGVDTKTDDKLAAKMSVLENAYIGQNSTINKINGFDELNNEILNPTEYGLSASVTKGEILFTNKDVLGLINSDQVLAYSDQNTKKWYAPNTQAMNLEVSIDSIDFPQSQGESIGLQVAEGPNDIVIVGSRRNLIGTDTNIFIRKNKTDGTIITDQSLSFDVTLLTYGFRVISIAGKVYLFSFEAGGANGAIFYSNVTAYSPAPAFTVLLNDAEDTAPYEVFVENNSILIVYREAGGRLVVMRYNSDMVFQNSYVHTIETRPIKAGYSISWSPTLSAYCVFYYTYDAPNFYHNAFKLTSALALSGSITSVNAGVNIDFDIPYYATSNIMSNGNVRASFESHRTPDGYSIYNYEYTGAALTDLGLVYGSRLAARSFVLNGKVLTPIRRSIVVLIDEENKYVCTLSLDTPLSQINILGQYAPGVGLPLAVTQYGSSIAKFKTSNFIGSSSREINDSSLVACGGMFGFDGSVYSELGFVSPPIVYELIAAPGGGVPAGTYVYAVTFSYTDLLGNVYESAPGFSASITTVATGVIGVRFLPCVSRRGVKVNAVKLYRRDTDGIFKLTNTSSFGINTISDTSTSISSNATLYTTGGVLENDPPPPANIFTTHADRVFCVNEERPVEVYFSKKIQRGVGIHFSSFLFFTVADNKNKTYERVTGLGSLDDKFIILKNQSLFAVFGDGPNELGVGSFSEPKLISADVGCRDARSVVSTAEGLMFMSSKGIYLLTRSLETVYIGAEVERFNNEEITSAILLPNKNQVQFTTRSGVRLTYSYFYRQWSWSLNREAQSAVTWKNKETHLKSNGLVRVENNTFLDINIPITQKIGTSWIKLNGIQNFQRIYRIMMLGSFKSPHKVSVKIYYDFEDYVWETVTVTPMASGYNATTKPTNEEIYNGGNDGIYQYEIQLSRQKCQALKIEISDFDQAGESFSLTGMSMIVGLKKGMNKITSSKKF